MRHASLGLVVTAVVLALLLPGCGGGGPAGTNPASVPPGATRMDGLVAVHRVSYKSFDGSRVPALVAIPRAGSVRGCLIWQYGLGSKKEDSAAVWQGAARLGLATFSIDFRDQGERAASADQLARARQSPAAIAALVRGNVADLRRAVSYLEAQPYCRQNVAYAGVSLGGIVGTMLAAADDRVRAAVFMSTPATWRTVVNTDVILTGIRRNSDQLAAALRILSPLDPRRFISKIRQPVMILNGTHDPVVPASSARALQVAARPPKTIVNYDGGHDPTTGKAAAANERAIGSFLLRTIVEPTYGISPNANGTYWQPAIN